MTKSNTDITILDDEQLFDLEVRPSRFRRLENRHEVGLTPVERDALCQTVRALKAENERLLKLYNSAWLWVQRRVKHPNSGMPPAAMTLMEMLPLLPDSMRSACVEKVKAMRSRWHDRYVDASADTPTALVQKELLFAKCQAASVIVKELESVSIQEQKKQ